MAVNRSAMGRNPNNRIRDSKEILAAEARINNLIVVRFGVKIAAGSLEMPRGGGSKIRVDSSSEEIVAGSDPQQDRNRWQDRQAGQTDSPGEPLNKNGDGSCKDETVSRVSDKKQSVDDKDSAAYDPFDASDNEDRAGDVLVGDGSWHSEPEKSSDDAAAGEKNKLCQESNI